MMSRKSDFVLSDNLTLKFRTQDYGRFLCFFFTKIPNRYNLSLIRMSNNIVLKDLK